MMKKILSIFAIVVVLFGLSGVFVSVAQATDACVVTDVAPKTSCVSDNTNHAAATCDPVIGYSVACTYRATQSDCSCVKTLLTPESKVFGPSNCIKIRSTFKMNLTNGSGVGESVELTSGAVVAPKEAFVTDCPYGAFSTKCTATITDKCVLNKPSEIGIVAMLNTIYNVTNWVFFIMTLLAVIMIVYGGFIYISAAGDPTKATKGKSILTLAMIGLAIALLAKFLPSLVKFILGVS